MLLNTFFIALSFFLSLHFLFTQLIFSTASVIWLSFSIHFVALLSVFSPLFSVFFPQACFDVCIRQSRILQFVSRSAVDDMTHSSLLLLLCYLRLSCPPACWPVRTGPNMFPHMTDVRVLLASRGGYEWVRQIALNEERPWDQRLVMVYGVCIVSECLCLCVCASGCVACRSRCMSVCVGLLVLRSLYQYAVLSPFFCLVIVT